MQFYGIRPSKGALLCPPDLYSSTVLEGLCARCCAVSCCSRLVFLRVHIWIHLEWHTAAISTLIIFKYENTLPCALI
jgi:hypothetical protein